MLLSALQHIFAGLKRTRDQKLSSGLMSGQLSSAITGLMLLTFTTTHLLTSRPTLRSRSPCIGGLCGDHSPHRTTMTQTKCCSIFAFWVMVDANGGCRGIRMRLRMSLVPRHRLSVFSHCRAQWWTPPFLLGFRKHH